MTVTVTGIAQGLSNATARLTGTIASNTTPSLTPNGIVNSASSEAGSPLAPGTLVQIGGAALSSITPNNTSVLVGAFPAPVFDI